MDRDGVINELPAPGDYIRTWSEFRFLPNAADWIRIFNALGFLVIVVTNQRGVASGLIEPQHLDEIHINMIRTLAAAGAQIDDVFVCPHGHDTCNCRKPKPGLIRQACEKWDIDLDRSLLIGDTHLDQELAVNCGLRFVMATGDGHISPAFESTGSPLS